jgi:hypothetical protein
MKRYEYGSCTNTGKLAVVRNRAGQAKLWQTTDEVSQDHVSLQVSSSSTILLFSSTSYPTSACTSSHHNLNQGGKIRNRAGPIIPHVNIG